MAPQEGSGSWAWEGERRPREMNPCLPSLDGVVLVDPDYLKDRKGTRPVPEGRQDKKAEGWPWWGVPESRSRIQGNVWC